MTNKLRRKLDFWMEILRLTNYMVRVEYISRLQVIGEDGKEGAGLVGLRFDEDEGYITIVSTRKLKEDDIVHELLHVKYPDWDDHRLIEEETASLIITRNLNSLEFRGMARERAGS